MAMKRFDPEEEFLIWLALFLQDDSPPSEPFTISEGGEKESHSQIESVPQSEKIYKKPASFKFGADFIKNVSRILGSASVEEVKVYLQAFSGAFQTCLYQQDSVCIVKFGEFKVRRRKALTGRNPATGELIEIPESKTIVIRPAVYLKESINNEPKHKHLAEISLPNLAFSCKEISKEMLKDKKSGVKTQAMASKYIHAIFETIYGELNLKGKVSIANFGKFQLKHRRARYGRNPKTGELIVIKGMYALDFSPSAPLLSNILMESPISKAQALKY